jgi:hypothetical protein
MDMITTADVIRAVERYYSGGALPALSEPGRGLEAGSRIPARRPARTPSKARPPRREGPGRTEPIEQR